jgi:hypothetical protein
LNDLEDNDNVKVINPLSNLTDIFGPPHPIKEDSSLPKDVQDEGSYNPSTDDILHQLNKLQEIAPEEKGNRL